VAKPAVGVEAGRAASSDSIARLSQSTGNAL